MRVETPKSVDVVRTNSKCYVNLSRRRNNKCDFVGDDVIEIIGAFAYLTDDFDDTVAINFQAENPSNTYTDDL